MNNKQFMIYAYSSPTDGRWFLDGKLFKEPKDFRTVRRYKEYRACGFNTLMLQANDPYCGEPFKTSQVKKDMDMARRAGINKVIIYDKRIAPYSEIEGGIIGEGKPFADEKTLDAFVEFCLSDYRNYPGFYGVMLVDEPRWKQLEAAGQLTRSLKRVMPEIFVQCNILPLYFGCNTQYAEDGADMTTEQAFAKYLRDYLDKSQAEYLLYDSYPMREEPECGCFILKKHLPGLQIAAGICKERHIPFYFVAQTTAYLVHLRQRFRACGDEDMRWQINCLLSFGVKSFSYYTYWRKQDNNTRGGFHPDGTQFICNNGKKAPLYNIMKKLHAEMQVLAPFLLDCEYVQATRFSDNTPDFLEGVIENDIPVLKRLGAKGQHAVVVTELKYVPGGNTVISVFNANDPKGKDNNPLTIEPQFAKELKKCFSLKEPEMSAKSIYVLDPGETIFFVFEK